jgi:hypothetical protein
MSDQWKKKPTGINLLQGEQEQTAYHEPSSCSVNSHLDFFKVGV